MTTGAKSRYLALFAIVLMLAVFAVRTHRRAQRVPESLNRKAAPSGKISHEGSGAVSKTEPEQAVGEVIPPSKKSTSDPKAVASMDLTELRRAVLAGDATRVMGLRGKVGPPDAGFIYALLNEIPAEANESDRRQITSTLTKLLMEIETEESSGYLLALLAQGDLLEISTRQSILWHLGLRKYSPAAPALELTAFQDIGLASTNERRGDRYNAITALIHLDPARYLSMVSQELRSVPDTNLWCLTVAFRTTAEMGRVDIAPAVADLQAKFLAVPRESWWAKKFVGEALAQYAHSSNSKSESVKLWLLSEVKRLLDPNVQAGMDDASREAYRDLLKFAETGKTAK